MNPIFPSSLKVLLALSLISVAPAVAAEASAAPSAAPDLHVLTYSGDQQALLALDRDLVAAGKDPQKLAPIEERLFHALRQANATYAARQAICQRLGGVLAITAPKPDANAYRPLPTMLADERQSDLARLALELAPGDVVDQIFVAALGKTKGRTRIGIADSLGRRRNEPAVPALAELLKDSDAATASAAANSLSAIANPAASEALRTAAAPGNLAIAEARLASVRRLPVAEAKKLLGELEADRSLPGPLRAAALRTSLEIDPTNAAARIGEVLAGSDWTFKAPALEGISTVQAPNFVPTLATGLEKWDAQTQAAVLAAFGQRADPAAAPALMAAVGHSDGLVRSAALNALGSLPGTGEIAAFLAATIAKAGGDEAKAARQSLARLSGADASAAILRGAERGDPALRAACLEQLGLRNMTEGIPLLLRCRADPDAGVRTAAIGALGEIAPASTQRAVLDWAANASDATEQSRALRSLVSVTLRNPAVEERARPIFETIAQAPPEVAARLLPVLPRLGGKASAECAARLAVRNDEKTAKEAVAALGRWSDRTALLALATVAENAAVPALRTTATQAVLRYAERKREPWDADWADLVSRLFAATKDPELRKQLVPLLYRASDERSLALAESLQSDATISDAARDAVAIVRANLAGPPAIRASGNTGGLRNLFDGKLDTRWSVRSLGDEWLEIDFKLTRPFHRLTFDQTDRVGDFPEHYEVYATDDLAQMGPVRASGRGQNLKTIIDLPPGTHGRYLVIKNTAERAEINWTVCELYVD